MKQKVLLISLVAVFLFCSGFSVKPWEWGIFKKTTEIIINIEASENINLINDESAPLALYIFQLKSSETFNSVDFYSLYEKPEAVLGNDFLHKKKITIRAKNKYSIRIEPRDEIRVIGLFAAFRDYTQAQWRATVEIHERKSNKIRLYIRGIGLTIS